MGRPSHRSGGLEIRVDKCHELAPGQRITRVSVDQSHGPDLGKLAQLNGNVLMLAIDCELREGISQFADSGCASYDFHEIGYGDLSGWVTVCVLQIEAKIDVGVGRPRRCHDGKVIVEGIGNVGAHGRFCRTAVEEQHDGKIECQKLRICDCEAKSNRFWPSAIGRACVKYQGDLVLGGLGRGSRCVCWRTSIGYQVEDPRVFFDAGILVAREHQCSNDCRVL